MSDDDYEDEDFEDDFEDIEEDENIQNTVVVTQTTKKQVQAVTHTTPVAASVTAAKITAPLSEVKNTITPKPPSISSSFTPVIDHNKPKNKQRVVLSKTEIIQRAARTKFILSQIKLSEEYFDILVKQPLSAQELQAFEISQGKVRSIGSQSNEDVNSIETQTEPISQIAMAAQVPDDQYTKSRASEKASIAATLRAPVFSHSTQQLHKFLRHVSPVCETLISERMSMYLSSMNSSSDNNATKLNEFQLRSNLELPYSLANRRIVALEALESRPLWIAVAYSTKILAKPEENDENNEFQFLDRRGIICIWDIAQPKEPRYILYTNGEISSLAIENFRSQIVVAGLESGGVVLWDLNEAISLHPRKLAIGNSMISVRHPSFSTDAEIGCPQHEHHATCVQRTLCISSQSIKSVKSALENTFSPPYQFITVDTTGKLILWTIVKLKDDQIRAFDNLNNYGLTIGSQTKLIKTDSQAIHTLQNPSIAYPESLIDLVWCRHNTNEYLAALSDGTLLRGKRFKTSQEGSFIYSRSKASDSAVRCISVAPEKTQYFAVGYSNGAVALYHVDNRIPINCWIDVSSSCISKIQWSPLDSGLIYILDGNQCVSLIDVREAGRSPKSVYIPEKQVDPKEHKSIDLFMAVLRQHLNTSQLWVAEATTQGCISIGNINIDPSKRNAPWPAWFDDPCS